jgi:uncharacterized protein (UPF0335 family)
MTTARAETRASLKLHIERIERLLEERRAISDDMKAVFADAKAEGFDTKAMRRIIKRREKDPHEVAEEDLIFDSYMHALGMVADPPLHAIVSAIGEDALSRDHLFEALQKFVPVNGEIIAKVGGGPMRLWRDEEGKPHSEPYVPPKVIVEHTARGATESTRSTLHVEPKDPLAYVKRRADAAEARSKARSTADESEDA